MLHRVLPVEKLGNLGVPDSARYQNESDYLPNGVIMKKLIPNIPKLLFVAPTFQQHYATPERKAKRQMVKKIGIRQYKKNRKTCEMIHERLKQYAN